MFRENLPSLSVHLAILFLIDVLLQVSFVQLLSQLPSS